MTFDFRPATAADFEALLDLSVRVMRLHLERVGRWDPARRRARMEAAFAGGGMRVIEAEGLTLGCVGVEPAGPVVALHSLYLEPARQGRGLGAAVVARLLAEHPGQGFRIEVLKASPARRFWERQGFLLVEEQPYDWVLAFPAASA
ncbi:GNAT family N-acetyltransferase [Falsiroseomonas selenitidurans]|uniref:GNAT family N-acetyltransferase n=1 Tax=Falsiroseomonas selenitidurans TaxID=2716335 RepID=A0ABX1E4Q8_9PROT|nr:GNAT family N-acetyltransferase [Falsiroseomonas selenitidurans]NKC32174.1 GNAT family N-acetyltransferase [Falsiroseomonas selenitidurans]